MPPAERNLLLNIWNPTTFTHLPVYCLHQLFEKQVKCDERSIAVEWEGITLSYSKLNANSNRLAHYLIAEGVKPDDRIALCAQRSIATVVANWEF